MMKQGSKPDPRLAFISAETFLEVGNVVVAAIQGGNRRILALAVATKCGLRARDVSEMLAVP
jgi:hypothetical protein